MCPTDNNIYRGSGYVRPKKMNLAIILLTVCHHGDGFVHSAIATKPESETGFGFYRTDRISP